ncbi:MAG: Mu transposase C-terminal domain-containing protein [Candidatus Neomarinimicrobiota bacterium]
MTSSIHIVSSTHINKTAVRIVNRRGAVVLYGRYYYNEELLQMAGEAVEISWLDEPRPPQIDIYRNGLFICEAYLDSAIL